MIDMQPEWQAETDYRSTNLKTHLRGAASLMRIACGPDGLPQRKASALLLRSNIIVEPVPPVAIAQV
jgi:hypothetical protein